MAFGFGASLHPDNFTLNLANKKIDQSLPDFQAGIGVAVHSTLGTQHLICHDRAALLIKLPLYRILMEGYYSFKHV